MTPFDTSPGCGADAHRTSPNRSAPQRISESSTAFAVTIAVLFMTNGPAHGKTLTRVDAPARNARYRRETQAHVCCTTSGTNSTRLTFQSTATAASIPGSTPTGPSMPAGIRSAPTVASAVAATATNATTVGSTAVPSSLASSAMTDTRQAPAR